MKLNEILLIGGALVAALVLSKGRGLSSTHASIPYLSPFSNLLDKAQAQAIEKLDTNIGTLESVRQSNLGIAQNILNYERGLKDVAVSNISNELDKTQSFISQQQKVKPGSLLGFGNFTGAGLLSKFNSSFNYYSKVWTGEKGPLSGVSIFPDRNLFLTESNRALIQQQAKYEEAQQNIKTASALVVRQSGEIDRLQEEYQTRYGNLSRYG
jgi:hypothetical protein